MSKEIAKVDYSLAGFDGPVGIAADLDSNDIKMKSVQLVQANHRALKVPGIKVSPGSFIDGDTFETLAEAFGSEKHPAPGINLIFINLQKVWKVFEAKREMVNGKLKKSQGDFIEKQVFSIANAGLRSFPNYKDKYITLTYRYIVKMPGKEEPMYIDFKGKGTNCAIELNGLFDDLWKREKRASFSVVCNIKVRDEPTGFDNNTSFVPYLNAYNDVSEEEFLKSVAMYQSAKEFMAKADEKDNYEQAPISAHVPDDMKNTVDAVKNVFEGAMTLEEDEINF